MFLEVVVILGESWEDWEGLGELGGTGKGWEEPGSCVETLGKSPCLLVARRPSACRSSALSVCFEPVCAPSAVGHEGHAEREGVLHLFDDYALNGVFLFGQYAEVKFVVYL